MAGPTDQETTVIEKIVCYTHGCRSILKRRRHGLGLGDVRGMRGTTRVGQERVQVCDKSLCCGSVVGMALQGQQIYDS